MVHAFRLGKRKLGDDPGQLLEVPVVVEQEQAVLNGDTGDEAIRGAADGDRPRGGNRKYMTRGLPVALRQALRGW